MNQTATTPTIRPTATPAQRKAQALQRLDASRTQIILRLLPDDPAPPRGAASTPSGTADFHGFTTTLLKRIERNGLVNGGWRMARAWGRRWWNRQPWHAPVELLASTLAHEAKPIIRRHPWATLAAGAALGAGLMAAMPWAGRTVRQRAKPWGTQVGGLLWTQLAQAPVQIALAGAVTMWLNELTRKSNPQAAQAPSTAPSAPDAASEPLTPSS